ncbi:MAG: DMT family transporter [Chloroflexi bacterium]|nr:DMT family transporter [Chloroflexota bacterium]
MKHNQAIMWALGTAIISGVSVFVNKFGVGQVNDPFVYTTLKNSLVAIGLVAAVGLLGSLNELRTFSRRQWLGWVALGLIGGGIPFLLFFQGLATASAPSAALIHKTLFIWVALLAAPFLGERLGGWQIAGLGVIALGQFLLQIPARWGWGSGEMLILLATLMWSVETIVAKRVLADVSARTAAFGRMGIGALTMWAFLALTGRAGNALALDGTQWFWIALTSIFLFGYVWTWYTALKAAPASLVTTVLTLAAIITIALTALLEGTPTSIPQLGGMLIMALGALVFLLPPLQKQQRAVEAS